MLQLRNKYLCREIDRGKKVLSRESALSTIRESDRAVETKASPRQDIPEKIWKQCSLGIGDVDYHGLSIRPMYNIPDQWNIQETGISRGIIPTINAK